MFYFFSSINEYIIIADRKTAESVALSVEIGSIFSDAPKDIAEKLLKFARLCGIVYQIQDDLLDITEAKGRRVGSEIVQGAPNIVTSYGFLNVNSQQVNILNRVYGNHSASEDDVRKAIAVLEETGAVQLAVTLGERLTKEAQEILKKLEIDKEFFEVLLKMGLKRKV